MITEYSEFPENVPRERIVRECLDTVAVLGKGWGTENIVFFGDTECSNYTEAQKFLSGFTDDADPYAGAAVLFKVYDHRCVLSDPKVSALKDEIRTLEKTISTYKDHIRVGGEQADGYMTCYGCGSSLYVPIMRSKKMNSCPLCHKDMRPRKDVLRIEALEEQLAGKRSELRGAEDEAKKGLQNIGLHWLVQYRVAT